MLNKEHITAMQAQGIRWVDNNRDMGLKRRGGAGPTDHKAINFDQQTAMIPVFNEQVDNSPFHACQINSNEALIYQNDKVLDRVELPCTPKFYDLNTADGIPYYKIATLHSKDVLATTILQTCVRYRSRETSCQFCAIEESLKSGSTIAEKKPEQIAEVAKAAVELDNVKQLVMTTGTPKTLDRGAAVLAQCARAVKEKVDIPIQAQCEPPADDYWFNILKDAGVDALGMHLEAVTDRVRKKIMPGKATVSLERYFDAYRAAVKVFGKGNVSTYILAGLGDSEQEILSMSMRLIDMGVYPFVVPFVPVEGTPLQNYPMTDTHIMERIFKQLGPAITASGINSVNIKAGCAKCGACSSLQSYE